MHILRKIDENLEEAVMFALLVAMVCIMGVQIVARYVFSSSLTWSEELTRYLFVCSGFLSASLCIKKSSSIKITELVAKLPKRAENAVHLAVDFLQVAFFSYLIPFAWAYVASSKAAGETSSAMGIPMWIPESITVIAFALCVFRLGQEIIVRFQLVFLPGSPRTEKLAEDDLSHDPGMQVAASVDAAEEAESVALASGEGLLFRDADGNVIRVPADMVPPDGAVPLNAKGEPAGAPCHMGDSESARKGASCDADDDASQTGNDNASPADKEADQVKRAGTGADDARTGRETKEG